MYINMTLFIYVHYLYKYATPSTHIIAGWGGERERDHIY